MRRLLFHLARLILKHYADRKYLTVLLTEHRFHMESTLDSKMDEFYGRLIHDIVPETPIAEHLQHIRNHYLMQYVYEERCFRLIGLLCQLEKYRLKGSFEQMDRYIFDLDCFYKKDIYAIWFEVLQCLNMKEQGLAIYLRNNTNLPREGESIRSICNHFHQ